MSYVVFTDSCSNIPENMLKELEIRVLPCSYILDETEYIYNGNISEFDSHDFYEKLRHGSTISTSLLNTATFLAAFEPVLASGQDIVYIGLSAGISGTIQAAGIAAAELKETYPERTVRIVDSMGAGLGTGILACRAADHRNEGCTADEAGDLLDEEVKNLCEYFIVGDLNFLRRTGRVSGAEAFVGSLLNIIPILRGDETGHIVASGKYRGKNKAIKAILEKYAAKVADAGSQRIAITHGDCPEEAEILAEGVHRIAEPKQLIICPHEPFTGAHVGPGMLALFFFGNGR